jgi:hypothetical protein
MYIHDIKLYQYTRIFTRRNRERLFLEAIEMLNFLEVMPLIELDEFDRTSEVSRIQFAEYMCRALNLDEFGFENKTFFPDVAKSHWGSTCVSALVQTGIISTGELFRPDDTITLTEACKILMHATGYNHYAVCTEDIGRVSISGIYDRYYPRFRKRKTNCI